MNRLNIAVRVLVVIGAVGILLAFRISNIDWHCAPKDTGLSYCRLNNASPRFLEGVAALIPEAPQVQIGGKVAILIPNLITLDESTRATKLASDIYAKMATDPHWAFVHSSLGFTYERELHFQTAPDQYYVYIPQHSGTDKLPVLLFLHGFGGDFTSYLYLLSQAADTAKFAIVAPTYGQGEWDEAGVAFAQKVLTEAGSKFPIDTNRVSLMGISNGGLIVPSFVSKLGGSLRNIVLLSTYIELGQYTSGANLGILKSLNTMKVIYGDSDKHIDQANIPAKVQALAADGVNAYYTKIPGEDHFLFFSQPQVVLNELLNLQF